MPGHSRYNTSSPPHFLREAERLVSLTISFKLSDQNLKAPQSSSRIWNALSGLLPLRSPGGSGEKSPSGRKAKSLSPSEDEDQPDNLHSDGEEEDDMSKLVKKPLSRSTLPLASKARTSDQPSGKSGKDDRDDDDFESIEGEDEVEYKDAIEQEEEQADEEEEQKSINEEEDVTEDAEGEFEVEAVLDHRKRGGKLQFLVSWRGYTSEHDTWEPEENVSHAEDIVKAYWSSNQKSLPKSSATAGKNGKRARTASTAPSSSKPAKSAKVASPAPSRPAKETEPVKAKDDDSHVSTWSKTHNGSLAKYEGVDDWEDKVASVDTIERDADGKLKVYLTMVGGERLAQAADVAYARCPQKILKFYEAHLK